MAASGREGLRPCLINQGLIREFVGKPHTNHSGLVHHEGADGVKKALYDFAIRAEDSRG